MGCGTGSAPGGRSRGRVPCQARGQIAGSNDHVSSLPAGQPRRFEADARAATDDNHGLSFESRSSWACHWLRRLCHEASDPWSERRIVKRGLLHNSTSRALMPILPAKPHVWSGTRLCTLYSVSGVALVSGSCRDALNFAFPDPAFDG